MDLTFLFLVLGILAAAATLVAYACIVVGARSEQPPDSSFFAKDKRHKQEKTLTPVYAYPPAWRE